MTILSNQNYALMGLHHSVKLPSIIQFPSGLKKSSRSTFYKVWTGCERAHPTTRNATFADGMQDTQYAFCAVARFWQIGFSARRGNAQILPPSIPVTFFRAAVRRGRILDQLGDSGRRDEEPIRDSRERGCKISDAHTRAQDRCLHKWP